MMKHILYILIVAMLCISVCGAIPTTDAVTGVSQRDATFNMHGGATECWFQWGMSATATGMYRTENDTSCGSAYQYGSPLLTGSTYYVQACDSTGCGNKVSFTTPAAIVSTRTYYGTGIVTIFKNGFNVTQSASIIVSPYTNTMTAPVTWGMLFFFIFLGLWVKPKDITIPLILAMVCGGAIWSGTSALGIPPEFADIGQGLLYAAVAGLVFSWFSK